jgi:hypothetical protein
LDEELQPRKAKIHLATWDGKKNPLDEYLAGQFEEWQSYQGQRNFGRPQVIALIALSMRNRWLFAGAYDSQG